MQLSEWQCIYNYLCLHLLLLLLYQLGMGYEKEKLTNHIVLWNILPSADLVDPTLNILTSCVHFVPLSQLPLLATLWMSDAHNVLSPAALLSSSRLMPMAFFGVISSLMWPSLVPPALYFPRPPAFIWCDRSKQFQFCHFGLQEYFRLNLLWDPRFLVVHGIYRALLRHHISNESIFPVSVILCSY